MDKYTIDNWKKIKEALEESGKTDSMFYRRAKSIVEAGTDPLDDDLDIK